MNKFDKYIREKIHDAELPVSGGLWESIESQLVVQKEPSRLWFLFLLGAFTLPLLLLNNIGERNNRELNTLENKDSAYLEQQAQEHNGLVYNSAGLEPGNTQHSYISGTVTSELQEDIINKNRALSASNFRSVARTASSNSNLNPKQAETTNTIADNFSAHAVALPYVTDINQREVLDQILPLSHIIKPVKYQIEKPELAYKRYQAPRDCPNFAGFNPGMYFFGELSLGKSSHSLMAKAPQYREFASLRQETEKSAFSYSAALGLGYQFQNGMIAESGLSYDVIKIKFDPQENSSIKNSTVIIVDTIISPSKDTLILRDTISIFDTGLAELSTYNTYKQIDIPLVIGYEFPLSSKLRMSVKGGILINLVSMSKGQIIGENNYLHNFGKGGEENEGLYKKNVGFGYTGGLNLEADLSDNITYYAGANIRYYPNSFSLASNPVNEKFHKIGLTTGIKYRL